jgi:predicted SnoaL-like aldol condensation-catalyzing enzyme
MRVLIVIFLLLPGCLIAQNEIIPITNESKPFSETVYRRVDTLPQFPGGEIGLLNFYRKHSKYPIVEKGRKAIVVYYEVVIDENGGIWNSKIVREQSESLNLNTINLISQMPKWKPGIKNGKPVKVVQLMEIRYATLD